MAESKKDFKLIPETIDEVTSEWCDKALHQSNCISSDVKVENVEVKRLTNEASDMSDGGGLSGSLMLKLKLTYRYECLVNNHKHVTYY